MKDVIVSFASKGRDSYNQSLLRLIESINQHWKGDTLIYSPDHWLDGYMGVTIHKGWPQPKGIQSFTHAEMPYQFKTALIQEAIEKGYERIIWLDSSMEIKKDLTPLFDKKYGVTTFHNLGHPIKNYLADHAEKMLIKDGRLDNDLWPILTSLYQMEQVWGGAFALDLTNQNAVNAFTWLKEYSVNGSFKDGPSVRPGFVAHRHDQSVMSVLWHTHMNMLPYGNILCPPHDRTGEYGTDPYLVCRGL